MATCYRSSYLSLTEIEQHLKSSFQAALALQMDLIEYQFTRIKYRTFTILLVEKSVGGSAGTLMFTRIFSFSFTSQPRVSCSVITISSVVVRELLACVK